MANRPPAASVTPNGVGKAQGESETLLSFAGLLKVKPLVAWKGNPSKPKGLRV